MSETRELIIESPKHGRLVVLYDAEDEDKVSAHKWSVVPKSTIREYNQFYVMASIPHPDGNKRKTTIRLHRLIMDTPIGMETDHINGNGLDNRKSNLRVCTKSENQRNRGAHVNNTSGYKGVVYMKKSKRMKNPYKKPWRARIGSEGRGKKLNIGHYATKEEAARAYDAKAKELHGEYAYLNFSDE